jgi:hypothetical protein
MKKISAIVILMITFTTLGLAANSFIKTEKRPKVKAQLTIYVEKPLLVEGGTVIVAANPVSAEKWAALPDGENIAADDMHNAKRAELMAGDRLFGVSVSATTSVVEFIYPEGGMYGFNFVARGTDADTRAPQLKTKEILTGDGGANHALTGKPWESVSTIHVFGPSSNERRSRAVDALIDKILEKDRLVKSYQGSVVHSLDSKIVNEILEKLDGSR